MHATIRAYSAAAAGAAGLVAGTWLGWYLSTPARPSAHAAYHAPDASRARYLNAQGNLDRAWGDWNLLAVRRDAITARWLVVGIDTEARCLALAELLETREKFDATCFTSAAADMGDISSK